jgi:hypothetical protein
MNADLNYFVAKWNYLKRHKLFKKSPATAIFRTAVWGMHCRTKW